MKDFLTEDEITEIFSNYLITKSWTILARAKGREKGSDIVAERNGDRMCIEAKGGGSQTIGSKRYGKPFERLQCQKHTDVAFACLPRMVARYKPKYVGMILPDDEYHRESISEILPAIKQLGAGAWLVNKNKVITLNDPTDPLLNRAHDWD